MRPTSIDTDSHPLRKVLGLRDLIPMQILLVIGLSWTGTAARQAGTHVSFWLMGAALLFLPVAAVVEYCVRIWPFLKAASINGPNMPSGLSPVF